MDRTTPPLDTRLTEADPGAAVTSDALATARAMVGETRAAAPARARMRRPVLVASLAGGLALTGGLAAATTGVLDLFGDDAPIVAEVTVPLGETDAGAAGRCRVAVNTVPADGGVRTDVDGAEIGVGSGAEFDAADYTATVAFLQEHDWSEVVTTAADGTGDGMPEGAVVERTGPSADDPSTLLLSRLSFAVQDTLAAHGHNLTGSAGFVAELDCDADDLG